MRCTAYYMCDDWIQLRAFITICQIFSQIYELYRLIDRPEINQFALGFEVFQRLIQVTRFFFNKVRHALWSSRVERNTCTNSSHVWSLNLDSFRVNVFYEPLIVNSSITSCRVKYSIDDVWCKTQRSAVVAHIFASKLQGPVVQSRLA